MADDRYAHESKRYVAYFSMEFGISHTIPTYSGGLGILAGDTLKSFADVGLPVVAMTLLNEQGYFHQHIDQNGNQVEEPVKWSPKDHLEPLATTVIVSIEGREVRVRAWKNVIRGNSGHNVHLFYLDTNIEGNAAFDRTLTSHLYGGDRYYRLCQEIVLGVGGTRMLDALGYRSIKKYHMNEGHAALLGVELLKKTTVSASHDAKHFDVESVRDLCVFTTHTPVAAGHDRFEIGLMRQVTGDYIPEFVMKDSTDEGGMFNMTLLGLNLSKSVNGVAKRHGEIARGMFPKYHISSITNGIHPWTWASPPFKELFSKHIPGWTADPFSLRNALSIPKEEVWDAHQRSKDLLIKEVERQSGIVFDNRRFTIGFGRRFTAYKRPDLLISNIERLKAIAGNVGDIQVVFAGKAHAHDGHGKGIIQHVVNTCKSLNAQDCRVKMVFLKHYDMDIARLMVAGCDVWLNTPQRPFEASGTSGMKAALNGVPHLSTLDGWWLEGHIEGVTGWSIGPHESDPKFNVDTSPDDEAQDLYFKLEKLVIPTYYGKRDEWMSIMRHCIAINASFFNTYRMVQQYITSAYTE